MHFQKPPFAQTKLVRCIVGEVFDVAVDCRKGSPTFGQSFGVNLSGENKRQLLIPKGFAHGFAVLSPEAIFAYKVDNVYNAPSEGGIFWNDPALNIQWPLDLVQANLSPKDRNNFV